LPNANKATAANVRRAPPLRCVRDAMRAACAAAEAGAYAGASLSYGALFPIFSLLPVTHGG